jgi:hypothetical protein
VPNVSGRTFLLNFINPEQEDQPPDPQGLVPARHKEYVEKLTGRLGPPLERRMILPRSLRLSEAFKLFRAPEASIPPPRSPWRAR